MTAGTDEKSPIVRLRDHLDLRIDGTTAFLASERDVTVVEGVLAVAVATRLDGTRTAEDIVTELAEQYPAEPVRRAISQLVDSGCATLEQSDHRQAMAGDAGFYEMGGVEFAVAAQRLAAATVAVYALGDAAVVDTEVIEHLRASGVGTIVHSDDEAGRHDGVDLSVVITDDYLRGELDILNRASLANGARWLLARPVGSLLWIGPIFDPPRTGCWACLAHRLAGNRQGHSYLQRRLGSTERIGMSTVRHRVASAIGAGLVAMEVIKAITGSAAVEPQVVTTDLLTGDSDRHYLTRRPQCPVCGDGSMMAVRALEPVRFSSVAKAATCDGGHRAMEPEAMVERYSRHVSPLTGVVTSVQRIPIDSGPLWVFSAGQNVARQPSDLLALRRGLRASSCGKGISEIQARASAIGEGIERSSAVFQGDELRRRATMGELGEAAIHPNGCMLFSARQYEQRHALRADESAFSAVFEPFLEDEAIDWSPVWSITNECTRWLPTQYLYYGYPLDGGRLFTYADSNGCASGTSLEDAALQGFCELIERDSVALWWYNRVRRPGIDLDSFGDPYIDRLRGIYDRLGREVWALDLTADFGIPAVGAFSRVRDGEREDILIAFGAHLDGRIAVLRALTEMNQFLPAVLPPEAGGAPTAQFPDPAFATWCRTATLASQPYLLPEPTLAPRTAASWPTLMTDDFAADLAQCQRLVEERHLELLVLDQTRPDIGLPVAKVIVPGLRHFWPRFAPGRLFDVPVALGWCPRTTEEADLNPVAIFI